MQLRLLRSILFILIILLALAACTSGDGDPAADAGTGSTPSPEQPATERAGPAKAQAAPPASTTLTASPEPTSTPPPTATAPATATATAMATSTTTPTPDPYEGLSIDSLARDTFGEEGEIEIVETLEARDRFTRYRIAFPSDGLRVGGFMNVPAGDGPFPVVIVNHGYMPPESYQTLTYTTRYADVLAEAGFLTIHPNFRNHRGSEHGPNPYRIGYTRDVLHLIPMAQRLPEADGGPVGMWGHSMGGGVTLRALPVTDQIAAAVLYGSMSGDEAKNYRAVMRWSNGAAAHNGAYPEPPANEALYDHISPLNFVDRIDAAIEIHHGVHDDQVPFEWSEELAQRLEAAGTPYHFYRYPEQSHNFTGSGYRQFNQRVISFFREHLR